MLRRWLQMIRLRLRSVLRSARVDAELDREMRAHLELQIDENVARGMGPDEARFAALRAFGGVDQMKEEARDARGIALIDNLTRDLRYSLRGLRRQPMLLLAATTSIALGVGGNIAVQSCQRAAALRTRRTAGRGARAHYSEPRQSRDIPALARPRGE
ncbi:MAG: permease prefix domain 1-containing protein [Gemmatimonadaceae bacterium]